MHNQPRVLVHQLHPDYSSRLEQITRKILNLKTFQHALAQIIDGIPTKDDYIGPTGGISTEPHPDIALRLRPTEEACALALKCCSSLDLSVLDVAASVCLID